MDREFAQGLVRKVLPSYEVGALLGEGSSGAVFLIRDNLKERAVKIVPLSASAAVSQGSVVSAVSRIERDFRHIVESYERLACDEIVTVYDFYKVDGEDDNRMASAYAVVVMELYPANLHGYILDHYEHRGGPLPAAAAQTLLEKLARLLEDLYSKRGFLFEDIKPENILIKEVRDEVKVVVGDIGGLKSLGSVSTSGTQVTLTYCAPEILRQGKRPDLRSIVYSFGLLSFFILEGHLPYDHAGATERIDLLRESGVPLERQDLAPQIREVIVRCLAFEPSERFEDFHEIAEALHSGIPTRKDRFSGETVDLGSFLQRPETAPAAGPAIAPVSIPAGGDFRRPAPIPGTVGARNPLAALGPLGALGVGSMQDQRRRFNSARTSDERQACEKASREIRELVVRKGDVYKISGDCRVLDDIRVEADAILVVENARVFFAEQAGIISEGTLRAKNATFTAIDPVRRWKNLALHPAAARVNVIEGCTFRYGRGRAWAECRAAWQIPGGDLNETYNYGGGLLVMGGQETGLTIQGCTFVKCTAQEGGGFFVTGSRPTIETCLFEGCAATLAGGGLACRDAAATVRNGRFLTCTAEKGGGGLACSGAPITADGCIFENCSTRYLFGGAVICSGSSPTIMRCKFTRCSASKDGGGIWWDETSSPRILQSNFIACTPSNMKSQSR